MKINYIFLFAVISFLTNSQVFSQELSDHEIGFDVEQATTELKERGFNEPQELKYQIQIIREMRTAEYVVMKKVEDNILKKIELQQYDVNGLLKTGADTDIPQSEREALLALFGSTMGNSWINKTGWDFTTPVASWNNSTKTGWYGITVSNGHVVSIILRSNNLNGPLPPEIAQLRHLNVLELQYNKLTNSIFPEIGQLQNLQILILNNNSLAGIWPPEIATLQNLQILSLNQNQLTGTLPSEIGQLQNLQILDLNQNQLTGLIPQEIGLLTNLLSLDLGSYNHSNRNNFTGSIPVEIGFLKKLQILDLSFNSLSGNIPLELGNLTQLQQLTLSYNQLSGNIPAEIGQLQNLQSLNLTRNQLTGALPLELKLLSQLKSLQLGENKLTGIIPSEIGFLSKLTSLSLNSNQFTGPFPIGIAKLANLTTLLLYSNGITGNIPEDIGQLSQLELLNLSSNGLSGTLPSGINNFTKLYGLYLSRNSLEGMVPDLNNLPSGCKIGIPSNKFRFIDFAPQFFSTNKDFVYAGQAEIDTPKNITAGIGRSITMTMYEDNRYLPDETFQWYKNSKVISSAISRELTISNVSSLDAGSYYCEARHPLLTSLDPATGRNLVLKRAVITLKTVPCSIVIGTLEIQNQEIGSENFCAGEEIKCSFNSSATDLTYEWSVIDNNNITLHSAVNTTGLYNYIPVEPGAYTIHLNVYQTSECKFEFDKTIIAQTCIPFVSCTKSNPATPKIKEIFTTLANKLLNLPAETIIDGYTCDELKALVFYIKEETPAIYNFVNNTKEGFIAFSFGNHADYDVKIASGLNQILDFNLDRYESADRITDVTAAGSRIDSHIKHIDFCSELYCVDHIAFVLDESGSISLAEADKIKKQLKKYIQQQADDNDKLQSNIYVSLTGMSDSDTVTRIDNISPTRLTNTDPAILRRFNNWIDNYRLRSGWGISASSDYWKTALDVTLNSSMKPNVVMIITDGCQTINVEALRDQTMARFSNSKSTLFTNSDKPHLYVIGIANGFYVDGGIARGALARSLDPNYANQITSATNESRVVPVLRTSLKYLLSFGETEYPTDKIDDFRSDFYGYENFDSLVKPENEAFFSDNLKLSKFSCGLPTDKNYCTDCLSFQPIPNKEYMLSAWVKEETAIQLKNYEDAVVNVVFFNNVNTNDIRYRIGTESFTAKGDIIDGWQRIVGKFLMPAETISIEIELENKNDGIPVYFDDIRIHPLDGSVKTFVYDDQTFTLMSELDENNYATFYEYDNEGGLVRIKKETSKGVKTIQETRSGNVINQN
ncbi:hypothetical protein [Flavobacterium sp. LAR06]|uniref:leucine-rich repeat domain-containing protein n=1 Tax=Flavobacterium sp. LAR06 TaxID=3064897 RepID=UPI0035C0A8E0